MIKKLATRLTAALAVAVLLSPQRAAAQTATNASASAAGGFPIGATFNGVPLNALRFGIGVTIGVDSSATGELQTTLVGTSALGQPQEIGVDGKATAGARLAAGIATFSGTCSVNMGDGTPMVTGVLFTAMMTTDADGKGTLTLTLGTTNLPVATATTGIMTIQ